MFEREHIDVFTPMSIASSLQSSAKSPSNFPEEPLEYANVEGQTEAVDSFLKIDETVIVSTVDEKDFNSSFICNDESVSPKKTFNILPYVRKTEFW